MVRQLTLVVACDPPPRKEAPPPPIRNGKESLEADALFEEANDLKYSRAAREGDRQTWRRVLVLAQKSYRVAVRDGDRACALQVQSIVTAARRALNMETA